MAESGAAVRLKRPPALAHEFISERAATDPMVTLEWSLERTEGVTLVGLVVAAERSCRVQIENRLEGPVWPPRRNGQPAEGWEDGTFTGCVPADGQLTVGYATPAPASEPPAAVVSTEPVRDGVQALDSDSVDDTNRTDCVPTVEHSPAGVVRALGDPLIPSDSVPLPDERGSQQGTGSSASECATPENTDSQSTDTTEAPEGPRRPPDGVHRDESARDSGTREGCPSTTSAERLVPSGVRDWLEDVEGRLAAADREDEGMESDATEGASPIAAARVVDRVTLQQVRRRAESLLARTEKRGSCRECGGASAERRREAVDSGGR